jgi:hypothetical protein
MWTPFIVIFAIIILIPVIVLLANIRVIWGLVVLKLWSIFNR